MLASPHLQAWLSLKVQQVSEEEFPMEKLFKLLTATCSKIGKEQQQHDSDASFRHSVGCFQCSGGRPHNCLSLLAQKTVSKHLMEASHAHTGVNDPTYAASVGHVPPSCPILLLIKSRESEIIVASMTRSRQSQSWVGELWTLRYSSVEGVP